LPHAGNDSRCANGAHETFFERIGDDELIAFKQPLLTALAQPVAVGELVGGPRAGTLVLIATAAPADDGVERFTHEEPVNAFAVD
jgi:hypothetical protein